MKAPREPNLRQIDPRLVEVRRRAAEFTGQWHAEEEEVFGASGQFIAEASGKDEAQHIADAHNYLLPLINQLLFRARSEEDLHEPGPATRTLPPDARASRP